MPEVVDHLRELSRRKARSLDVAKAAEASGRLVRLEAATTGDVCKQTRRRPVALLVAPARRRTVCTQSAGIRAADYDAGEDAARSDGFAVVVRSPAVHAALGVDSA